MICNIVQDWKLAVQRSPPPAMLYILSLDLGIMHFFLKEKDLLTFNEYQLHFYFLKTQKI